MITKLAKFVGEMIAYCGAKVIELSKVKYVEGKGHGKLEKSLVKKLKNIGLICLVVVFVGCTKVYIPHGQAVQLRESIEDVDVWVIDKDGKRVATELPVLPEGYYCLPHDYEEEPKGFLRRLFD